MAKVIKTVLASTGMPLLELVKEADGVVIYEADDMDRQVNVPVSAIPTLIKCLDELK
ncbi:MAG TPA: hypothetical protein VMU05_15220 [Dongiaceae bacterium]|nr:hypothetical protein [Dongiaceae bacterium]